MYKNYTKEPGMLSRHIAKLLLIMRLTTLMLIMTLLQVSAASVAQKVSLNKTNASLKSVLKDIRTQSGYDFIVTESILTVSKPVSINIKDTELIDVLDKIFVNQSLSYSINKTTIIIKEKEISFIDRVADALVQIDVNGRVLDENGQPLPGVTVKIKDDNQVTITDKNGIFSFKNVKDNSIISLSSIGYLTREVKANSNLGDIKLEISTTKLSEVVVNKGYYTTTEKLNTGTVSKVSSIVIERQPVSNPLLALQGRVSGLSITQNNGLPGSGLTIKLRGQNSIQNGNSPLYVIDGVPFLSDNSILTQRSGIQANNPFNSLNSNDIESIEVLKDADATAIYGSLGANGVVLITTKGGRTGKTSVDFNIYSGFGKVTRTVNFLNREQYLQMRREAYRNDGVVPTASSGYDLVSWDTTRYTDYKNGLIGGTAHSNNAQLRISGGSDNTNFTLGSTFYRETTVFPGSTSDRRTSFDFGRNHKSTNNKLSISFRTSYANDNSNLIAADLTQYINEVPVTPALYDEFGNLKFQDNGFSYNNPFAQLLQTYQGVTDRLTGSVVFNYKLFDFLSLKVNSGYNDIRFKETYLTPIAAQNPSFSPRGSNHFGNNFFKTWIVEPQMEFSHKVYNDGNISFIIGSTLRQTTNNKDLIEGFGYTSDFLLGNIASAASQSSTNSYTQYKYNALYGRLNLAWDEKYLINITGRRDGSSRFGPGKRFSNFGAVGLGWNFFEEKFIKEKIHFLSFGKLRGSYGITGNDQIGDYQYLDTYSNTQYQYQGQPGLAPSRLFNPDYTWEKNEKAEIALELGFFNDRIRITTNRFINISNNQILFYNLPAQVGNTSILKNFPGKVKNDGWEIELATENIKSNNFKWITSFNVSFLKNTLVEFPNLSTSSYSSSYIIGQPLNIKQGYVYTGVDPQTGVYTYKDINNDGNINTLDYVNLGSTDPKFFGGLQNSFSFRGFNLDFLFQFVKQQGTNAIYNYLSNSPAGDRINSPIDVLSRWQNPGDISSIGKFTQNQSGAAYAASNKLGNSSAVLTDASFIRLKNIFFSYSLPSQIIHKASMQSCKLYIEAQNLFTITKFQGADPENQNIQRLPPLRMITFGLQTSF